MVRWLATAAVQEHVCWKSADLTGLSCSSNFVESRVGEAYDARAMHFEYEITADQFVASQLLYYKLSGGRKHRERAVQWILAGIILVAIAWSEWSLN